MHIKLMFCKAFLYMSIGFLWYTLGNVCVTNTSCIFSCLHSLFYCKGTCSDNNNCNGIGTCNPETNSCECAISWTGTDCTILGEGIVSPLIFERKPLQDI